MVVFQYGKERGAKKLEKAGNCGDKVYFIMKQGWCKALLYRVAVNKLLFL
jgi:hypothetical protein